MTTSDHRSLMDADNDEGYSDVDFWGLEVPSSRGGRIVLRDEVMASDSDDEDGSPDESDDDMSDDDGEDQGDEGEEEEDEEDQMEIFGHR